MYTEKKNTSSLTLQKVKSKWNGLPYDSVILHSILKKMFLTEFYNDLKVTENK